MTSNTVFQSNKWLVGVRKDDYRYVEANKNIKKGELLLIEHCYLSKRVESLPNIILYSPELFDNLFPRNEKWKEELLIEKGQTKDIINLINEKAQKNSFMVAKDKYSVGLNISNFNHSTSPNAYVKSNTYIIDENVSLFIMYIISDKEINVDEEITISYGNGYFGDNMHINDYTTITIEADILVQKIMKQYIHKKICINMIVKHISMFYGLYIYHDLVCPTTRFITKFKELTHENIDKWLYEKELYYKILLSIKYF
jgi:hypothetical protein